MAYSERAWTGRGPEKNGLHYFMFEIHTATYVGTNTWALNNLNPGPGPGPLQALSEWAINDSNVFCVCFFCCHVLTVALATVQPVSKVQVTTKKSVFLSSSVNGPHGSSTLPDTDTEFETGTNIDADKMCTDLMEQY